MGTEHCLFPNHAQSKKKYDSILEEGRETPDERALL